MSLTHGFPFYLSLSFNGASPLSDPLSCVSLHLFICFFLSFSPHFAMSLFLTVSQPVSPPSLPFGCPPPPQSACLPLHFVSPSLSFCFSWYVSFSLAICFCLFLSLSFSCSLGYVLLKLFLLLTLAFHTFCLSPTPLSLPCSLSVTCSVSVTNVLLILSQKQSLLICEVPTQSVYRDAVGCHRNTSRIYVYIF